MNRRETLKAMLAGLFTGWWSKKVEAKPQEIYSLDWWGHATFEEQPTKWITHIKSTPEIIWDTETIPHKAEICDFHGMKLSVIPAGHLVIYVGQNSDVMRQLIGVARLQDGSTILQLGVRKDEISNQSLEVTKAYAEQACEDLRELEWKVC